MTQWIAGQWVAGQGEAMTSVSPYDNQVVWKGDSATPAQVESAVAAAREAFLTWKKLSFAEREAIVLKFAEKVKENSSFTLTGIALSPKNGAIRKSPVNRTKGHQSTPSHWVISVKVICIMASQPCLVSY